VERRTLTQSNGGSARPAEVPAREPTPADYHHERLELAVEATELGLWEWDIVGGGLFWSERQRAIFGLPAGVPPSYEMFVEALHPDDREWVLESVARAVDPAVDGRLQIEHRIVLPSGEVRWLFANARCLFAGSGERRVASRLLGTVLDITDRKRAEEERQLLVRELNHRVKNLFAVASSLVALTARAASTPQAMGEALRGRFAALGRAHELIRPAAGPSGLVIRGTQVADLAAAVLAPYGSGGPGRLALDGPALPVGPQAATSLTLVLHELATNAVKYGSLGDPAGRLAVAWHGEGDDIVLTWREQGGPPVAGSPASEGFGSRLARKTVEGQLGGSLTLDWAPGGLTVIMRVHREALEN
jgi:PAS domain S-box-containing protein